MFSVIEQLFVQIATVEAAATSAIQGNYRNLASLQPAVVRGADFASSPSSRHYLAAANITGKSSYFSYDDMRTVAFC